MNKNELNKLISLLAQQGLLLTSGRKAVISVLAQAKKPLSAAEIMESALIKKEKINRATVYRSLSFLESKGVLELLRLSGDERLYHLNLEHHHHLVCTLCHKIEVIHFCNQLNTQEDEIKKSTGFTVKKHVLEFYGLCRECSQN
ncbi:transcriptional repressor [Patescibacteria group bacterium]|nr:transcriptional repressor [Patescibacteria group bacterium]